MKKFDSITPLNNSGKIILTGFPGLSAKKTFSQDKFIDTFTTLKEIKCHIVITLIEEIEFANLCSKNIFEKKVSEMGLVWYHLSIQDYKIPNKKILIKWQTLSPQLQLSLSQGNTICIHCMGGLGRSGTIASMLLIDLGEENAGAIRRVRNSRKGAIENTLQENFVKNYKTVI